MRSSVAPRSTPRRSRAPGASGVAGRTTSTSALGAVTVQAAPSRQRPPSKRTAGRRECAAEAVPGVVVFA